MMNYQKMLQMKNKMKKMLIKMNNLLQIINNNNKINKINYQQIILKYKNLINQQFLHKKEIDLQQKKYKIHKFNNLKLLKNKLQKDHFNQIKTIVVIDHFDYIFIF